MKLNMWDVELKQEGYIKKIIRFRLPYANDADLEGVYQAVLKSLRRKVAKDYELKAKYGVKSLKTFLKRITLRRVVDYLRKRSVLEQTGEAPIQVNRDLTKIGVLDENIERFLRRGPRKNVTHVGGIEIRPLLNQIGNKLMWITLAEQLAQSEKIERERRLGWNEHGGKRVLTRKEIIERIASDWGISTEAVRLRLYRSRRKFRMLWDRAKRLQDLKRISYNRDYQTHL
jgi:DNA-directed RNA polymerase specialized sigma24 family protein